MLGLTSHGNGHNKGQKDTENEDIDTKVDWKKGCQVDTKCAQACHPEKTLDTFSINGIC